MPSQCYPKAREKFGTAQLNWVTGVVHCVLLPDSYVVNLDDEFLSDIPVGSRIAISEPVTGRTMTDGFAYADPVKFPLLIDNREAGRAVFYKDTGVENTSPLIFLLDQPELVTAPFALVGFDYFIYPNVVEGGFFRL
jgi:hypothetical protein